MTTQGEGATEPRKTTKNPGDVLRFLGWAAVAIGFLLLILGLLRGDEGSGGMLALAGFGALLLILGYIKGNQRS